MYHDYDDDDINGELVNRWERGEQKLTGSSVKE